MSVPMSILALLDEQPRYGLQLKEQFEHRTGGVWPLNVGQVYTTLNRLERDGLVEMQEGSDESHKVYEITELGRASLAAWYGRPTRHVIPARDEIVLKMVMAATNPAVDIQATIQTERRAAVRRLQEYTKLKKDAGDDADLGWLLAVDSLIFKTESRVRWLDVCEERIARAGRRGPRPITQASSAGTLSDLPSEAST